MPPSAPTSGSLSEQIEVIRAEAGFEVVLVADTAGQILEAARSDEASPELIEGLLEIVTRLAANPEEWDRLELAGESVFQDWEGRQVVIRRIAGNPRGELPRLVLILAPPKHAYKRSARRLETLLK